MDYTYEQIAKMIDHSLLNPILTDEDLEAGCELALRYDVACVFVKPYYLKLAAEILAGSRIKPSTTIGFPHGGHTTAIKVAEVEQALRDGGLELDMVVNIGKVLSEDWDYIEREIQTISGIVKKHRAVLKVIFENDLLPEDHFKIRLCEICSKYQVDFVKTSTGYNYVKGPDGKYSYQGATEHDLRLMRQFSDPQVQVKAAGGVGNLDAILKVKDLGVTRVGTKGTRKIIEDARKRFGS